MSSPVLHPFSLVFAADASGGLGKGGTLPWRLSSDMKYFKETTLKPSSTKLPSHKMNVCIMGRKSWESIPDKFRPLEGRINVVLSSTLDEDDVRKSLKEGAAPTHVFNKSLPDCLAALTEPTMLEKIDKVFVIGGARLIEESLELDALHHVHLTRILDKDYDCDVKVNLESLNACTRFNETHRSEPVVEKDVTMTFCTYSVRNREEKQYLNSVEDIIKRGFRKGDRTGVGTISKFGDQMRYSLRDGVFPLLTTKRVFWRGVAEELFWFVKGCTDGNVLKEKGVGIWDGNGTREFLDSRGLEHREENDLGPIYGFQWRHFGAEYKDRNADYTGQGVDQLAQVIHTIKTNPDDRRIILSAWNPAALKEMALPPCHVLCQFYVANGELSCQMYQRSCDMGLGVPFNIASYSLLTVLLADVCGLKPGDFIHSLGDAHVYTNHVDPLKKQLEREPRPFPTLKVLQSHDNIEDYSMDDLALLEYHPYPAIKMEMA
ncbi:Bifunctional dihydrofolate reductase-thymidylate synthase, partial [Diplonema papillatum]